MAYLIKHLGKKNKGEKIAISSTIKNLTVILINQDQKKTEINLTNGTGYFLIPETGLWILKCRDKNNQKCYSFDMGVELEIV